VFQRPRRGAASGKCRSLSTPALGHWGTCAGDAWMSEGRRVPDIKPRCDSAKIGPSGGVSERPTSHRICGDTTRGGVSEGASKLSASNYWR